MEAAAEVTGGAEEAGGAGAAVRGAGREAGGAPPPREAVARVGGWRGADFLGGTGECLTGMAGGSGINIRLPDHEVKGHAQGP